METQNNSPEAKHEHVKREKGEHSPLDTIKKWIGLGAAIISFGSAIFGVLSYQADKRARAHEVADLLAASHTEQAGSDYAAAWKSLQSAIKIIDNEKGLVKMLGGLDKEQEQVHTAQEDLGMEWLRMVQNAPPAQGHTYTEVADPVIGVLSGAAEHASGSRKADLLAHIGWAYFLKVKESPQEAQVAHYENFYRQAIANEAANPYAQTFYGYSLVTLNSGPSEALVSQAQPYFVAALSSKRTSGPLRAWVREREFRALHFAEWFRSPAEQQIWWQAVTDMVKAGETIEAPSLLTDLEREYVKEDSDRSIATLQKNLDHVLGFAPIEEHLRLLHVLLDQTNPDPHAGGLHDQRLFTQVALANALEKAGKPSEALAVWRDAKARMAAGARDDYWHLDKVIDAAITRLSAAGPG